MQPWHRWREPLAVVLLVALALMLVVRAVGLGLAIDAGTAGGLFGVLPGGDDLLLAMSAAAVLWCATSIQRAGPADDARTPSAHAWPIAVAGLVIVGLTVLGWLALVVSNVVAMIPGPTPDAGFVLLVIEGLLRLAVPAAALVAVGLAVRRVAAAIAQPARPAPVEQSEDAPAVTAAPERLPAAWQADEATGAVWLTADDAATGQPGLSWSHPAATPGALPSGPWSSPPTKSGEPVADEDDDLR